MTAPADGDLAARARPPGSSAASAPPKRAVASGATARRPPRPGGPALEVALLGTRGVPARYGAFELAADRIATLGGRSGVSWTIYCPAGANAPQAPARYGRAKLVHLPHGEGRSAPLGYDLRCLLHAARSDVDAVVMLGYGAGPLLLVPRLFGKPVITNTDGFEYKRSKWPWYAKLWFRFAEAAAALSSSALISDSAHMCEHYARRYGRRSTFIAYGTDRPAPAELEAAQGRLDALLERLALEPRGYHVAAMRLEPENSLELIVESARSNELRLPVLVVGPSTPTFERLLERVPRGHPGLRVAGPIYDRALLFLVRRSALSYVHGHTVGGINPAILEALSTGTPVVARDTPYNREVLGGAGIYFDDAPGLLRGLRAVEAMDERRWVGQAAAVGRRRRAEFTWEAVVDAYETLVRARVAATRALDSGAGGA